MPALFFLFLCFLEVSVSIFFWPFFLDFSFITTMVWMQTADWCEAGSLVGRCGRAGSGEREQTKNHFFGLQSLPRRRAASPRSGPSPLLPAVTTCVVVVICSAQASSDGRAHVGGSCFRTSVIFTAFHLPPPHPPAPRLPALRQSHPRCPAALSASDEARLSIW